MRGCMIGSGNRNFVVCSHALHFVMWLSEPLSTGEVEYVLSNRGRCNRTWESSARRSLPQPPRDRNRWTAVPGAESESEMGTGSGRLQYSVQKFSSRTACKLDRFCACWTYA